MDFGTLLQVAQKTASTSKNDIKYYSTKFEPPKKEEKKKDKLSENIKKFLARKEAEEKQKAEEARIKKLELLALRAQDSKAKKRVAFMLNRTKSANKSAIDDAVDHTNTALTLAGPSQPDEDDYGYESQESALIYAKMMERYSNMPEEEKFSTTKKKAVSTNLASTKERVKAALLREEEEANMPHKRKRKSKSDDAAKSEVNEDISNNNQDVFKEPEKPEKEKPKKRPMPPPIMNFNDLLKIAEKKQHEPIIIEPKKTESDEPLLTKKQKRELEKEKAWRESREARLRAALTAPPRPKEPSSYKPDSNLSSKSTYAPPNKIPKLNSSKIENRDIKLSNGDVQRRMNGSVSNLNNGHEKIPKTSSASNRNIDGRPQERRIEQRDAGFKKPDNNGLPTINKSFKKLDPNRTPSVSNTKPPSNLSKDVLKTYSNSQSYKDAKSRVPPTTNDKQKSSTIQKPVPPAEVKPRQYLPGDLRAKQQQSTSQTNVKSKPNVPTDPKARQLPPSDLKSRKIPPSDSSKPKQFPPADLKPKQFPPSDLKPKQFPPADLKPKQFPPADLKPKQFPPADLKPKQFPPADLKPKQFPPADLRPKQFPPADLKPKQFPPPDVRSRQFPSKDVKRKPKRPIIDDDSEYDSELDDFIDDGPQEDDMDYSRHIKEIFGYDKSRYRDLDDDDDAAMESKFSTILKEEYLSTKIGIMEDLEDIRKEAEEKKRKALMKKKMKR